MDFSPIKDVYIFDGQKDSTFEKIRIWKGVFYSILAANEAYLEKLQDGIKIISLFCLSDSDGDQTSRHVLGGARLFVDLLVQVCNFHQNVLGGLETFRDPHGPFGALNRMNSNGFQSQGDISASVIKEHQDLESAAMKALEKYQRHVMKRDTVRQPRVQRLSWKNLCSNRRPTAMSQKVDEARLNFALLCRNEIKHREVVLQQTRTLEKEFLKDEREKIQALFSTINVVWEKMCDVIPYHVRRPKRNAILPKDTDSLAKLGWECHLKLYKFPEYKVDQNNIHLAKEIEDIVENVIQTSTRETGATMDSKGKGTEGSGRELSNEVHSSFTPAEKQEQTHALMPSEGASAGDMKRTLSPATCDNKKKQQAEIKTKQTSASRQSDVSNKGERHTTLSSQNSRSSFFEEVKPSRDDVQKAFDKKMSTLGKRATTFTATSVATASSVSVGSSQTKNLASLKKDSHQKVCEEHTESEKLPSAIVDVNLQNERVELHKPRTSLPTQSPRDIQPTTSLASKTDKKKKKGFFKTKGSKSGSSADTNVAMMSIRARPKQNPNEISLREGMRIKMTTLANDEGMAYGYKRTRLGLKKYGFFPANAVVPLDPGRQAQ